MDVPYLTVLGVEGLGVIMCHVEKTPAVLIAFSASDFAADGLLR
jgi:hypothetical protein